MKLLFGGDTLNRDIAGYLAQAARNYPEARLIIGKYDIADDNTHKRWQTLGKT